MPNSDDSVRLWGGRFASGPAEIDLALVIYGRIGHGAVPAPEAIPFVLYGKI